MATSPKLTFADLEAVGPGTHAGRYLRLFWHPIFRARDLRPAEAKPIEILGEKFTLYRGESGTSHIVAFRCAHRGVQLSVGWVEGDDLRCRYHGWKYDCTGQCVEQPDDERPFPEKVKIQSFPSREYAGLIFGYFGEGAPPPFRLYPALEQPGVIVTDPTEIVPCSFWNRIDNDIVHIPWVHRATALRKGRPDFIIPRTEAPEEAPWGWTSMRYAKGKPKGEGMRDVSVSSYYFMPNALQFAVRTRARGFEGRDLWDTKITWNVPINDHKFAAFDVTHTPLHGEEARAYAASRAAQQEAETENRWDVAEKILAGEMTIEQIPIELSAYNSFAIEDYVTQVGQGPIKDRPEYLANTDRKVVLTRRLWLREVTALLEGRPLTQWDVSAVPSQVFTLST